MTEGGHFSALEVPQLYAKDLRDFFIGINVDTMINP